jgi:all-trans-8'-apo-beta-carotenal 15,15'-oxygenase
MDRRCFLKAGLGLGALTMADAVRADQETYRRFHAALLRDPTQVA